MFKTYVNASAGAGGQQGMSPIQAPSSKGTAGWTPSVMYMVLLVAAEIFLVGYISAKL